MTGWVMSRFARRFGGSQSSQSQAASKASDGTAGSAAEAFGMAADTEKGGELKEDLDPFSSLGPVEATQGETDLVSSCTLR